MNTEEQILEGFLGDLNENRLILPTLPEVALRVRDAVENEGATIGEITRVISSDAAISARLLQVCNSPLYRTRSPIEDLQTAISRLGDTQVKNLVSSLVMQQMFQATSDVLDKKMRRTWEHSTTVASISYVLSAATKLSSDQAMLAGLIHDIGTLPIIVHAEDMPELRNDPVLLDKIISKLHPIIGEKILRDWGFPQAMVDVAAQHENLVRDPGTDDYDMVDIVIVANLHSLIGDEHDHDHADLDWKTVPAFKRLGIEPEINIVDIEENKESLEEIQAILS